MKSTDRCVEGCFGSTRGTNLLAGRVCGVLGWAHIEQEEIKGEMSDHIFGHQYLVWRRSSVH